jgi:hypothetical protein
MKRVVGMLIVETIARIRREHFIKGKTIKETARDLSREPNLDDGRRNWMACWRRARPNPLAGSGR